LDFSVPAIGIETSLCPKDRAISHLTLSVSRAGRERALRYFDWDRTAEQFERIYADVMARTGR